MYAMYVWDEMVASEAGATIRSVQEDLDFSESLQFALDRRDNGGDARPSPFQAQHQ